MGYLSYLTTRHYLLSERENASQHQAFDNASVVLLKVHSGENIDDTLSTADAGTAGSHSVLEQDGIWYATSILVGRTAIPANLRALVKLRSAANQTYTLDGTPAIAVGVPLPSIHGAYYEIFDISDLQHILRILALALVGAGLVTTLLGAIVGRWAAGRSLRPLTDVSRAAVAIADGRLSTRLEAAPGDPDLDGLTSSFNRMVDQLQERIEREARFTSDVSHELRSPLTTLSASLEVIETNAEGLTPSGTRALELLAADVKRFQRMVGDLLEISRADTGSADLSLDEVDPGELVRQAVGAAMRSVAPGTAAPTISVDRALEGTRLSVDKRRFERVMTNLIENAALYGGGATTVSVTKSAGDHTPGNVLVSISDHGAGISEGERERIFERFYRGQVSGQRGSGTGTGLGLALVAEHVRLHGGRGGRTKPTVEAPGSTWSFLSPPSHGTRKRKWRTHREGRGWCAASEKSCRPGGWHRRCALHGVGGLRCSDAAQSAGHPQQ